MLEKVNSSEDVKHLTTEEKKEPEHVEIKEDWAEEAYQELADYIEEQGIYIRY